MSRVRGLGLSFLLIVTWAAESQAGRYAVIVGRNDGGEGLAQLRWAEKDAGRLADLLVDLGGFNRSDIRTVLHPDSSGLQKELDNAMKKLRSVPRNGNNLFLFYYSGHADEQRMLLGKEHFLLSRIEGFLDSIPAEVRIGIFDACQSGVVTAFKGGTRAEPFYFKNQSNVKGQIIIASASATERAQESEMLKGSIFTYHWLNALRGSADVSGDSRITLNEAYTYAYRKTIETTALTTGEIQHPMYRFAITGQGDIILTDLNSEKGGVVLDKGCEGKFLILSDTYDDVYADFAKKKGRDMRIAIAPGAYTVINARGQDILTCSFALDSSAIHRITSDMLHPAPFRESRIKGGSEPGSSAMSSPEGSGSARQQPAETGTRPLSVYSWGLGTGAVVKSWGTNGEPAPGIAFTFANELYMRPNVNLFFDIYTLLFGPSAGGLVGANYHWAGDRINPYMGVGAGLLYIKKENMALQRELGFALTAHFGLNFEVNDRLALNVRIPLTFTMNGMTDRVAGIELRFMVRGPYTNVRVLDTDTSHK